ncbi:hypothetical protein AURDEDRAFT_177606 [Auricularia subglabra TFB-10046 SS5]|uniref:Uncharacterized protein n=1 Tax=Auricularia subglabra (strain TFB-10046 / SS5) TaxID=717982 RepID=J0D3Q7_AURST|nr:hypothetical protein AURDEDRAFT_177606 [Auricularia subglabra TFB-10046 SS5]
MTANRSDLEHELMFTILIKNYLLAVPAPTRLRGLRVEDLMKDPDNAATFRAGFNCGWPMLKEGYALPDRARLVRIVKENWGRLPQSATDVLRQVSWRFSNQDRRNTTIPALSDSLNGAPKHELEFLLDLFEWMERSRNSDGEKTTDRACAFLKACSGESFLIPGRVIEICFVETIDVASGTVHIHVCSQSLDFLSGALKELPMTVDAFLDLVFMSDSSGFNIV